ncbi:MAG: PQQ-binding-like beta-propeller repeat protein, partial [Sedimentisphaerales bacterium]|nr:PQQ-binding-like beta-propeller repeat protein [Sedimentisphaerales bacterium]
RRVWVWGVVLVMVLGVVSVALGEDWPCFRGAGRQGISLETDVPLRWGEETNVAWKTAIAGAGWSSPIVCGERVFVTTATQNGTSLHLLCLDRKTGTVRWDREVVKQEAGHKQRFNSYATSTPATDGQRVYVLAFDGRLTAVTMDGQIAWVNKEFDYYYSEHGIAVSPVLYEDLVIVPYDWSSPGPDTKVGWQIPWDKAVILGIERETGRTRWRGKRGLSCIAHVVPQIAETESGTEMVSAAGNVIQGFDPATGERLWTVSSPGEGVVPSVVVGEGLAFTASGFGDSTIRAVRLGGRGDVSETHLAWQSQDDVPRVPSMLYVAPHLYVLTESGVARCLQAATGKVVWRERLAGKFSASPVWAEGRVYFLAEKGTMTVVAAGAEFKVLAENQLDGRFCASPAISQGHMFLRSDEALYCIGP